MLRQGHWKMAYSHHAESPDVELYNLESDPGEFQNLADDGIHTAAQQRLASRIMEIWGDADALGPPHQGQPALAAADTRRFGGKGALF